MIADVELIDIAARKLIEARANNNGRAPHNYVKQLLYSLKEKNVHATKNMIDARAKKLSKKKAPFTLPYDVEEDEDNRSHVSSSLTNPTTIINCTTSNSGESNRGRPKGSTLESKINRKKLQKKF